MILQDVFLIDSEYVKKFSTVSDNMEDKYINPCIVTAQTQDLQQLIGTALCVKLCDLYASGDIEEPENTVYNDLLTQYVQPYLLYCTQAELLVSNMAKLRNSGNMHYLDTNQQAINSTDVKYLVEHYRNQSTFAGNRVVDFCRCNASKISEWKQCTSCCNGLPSDPKSGVKIGFVL